jgi:hypothetical protein
VAPSNLSDLIVELEEAITAIPGAVRALFRLRRLRSRPAEVARVGEHERVEESKYYPPAPSRALKPEQEELPDSYGHTRLVMMVVNPYLVCAYWEVSPEKLAAARQEVRSDAARVVLRFYEVEDGASVNQPPSGWFDVDVDLRPRNWYVDLWSADKTYYTELGLRGDDGQLVPLARSNLIRTPRARPVVKVKEDFMRVEPARQLAELVPPPTGRRRPTACPAAGATAGDRAAAVPVEAGDMPSPVDFSGPVDSAETLRKKLSDFHTLRGRACEAPEAGEQPAATGPGKGVEEPLTDLVEMTERQFTPGISSPAAGRRHPEE